MPRWEGPVLGGPCGIFHKGFRVRPAPSPPHDDTAAAVVLRRTGPASRGVALMGVGTLVPSWIHLGFSVWMGKSRDVRSRKGATEVENCRY